MRQSRAGGPRRRSFDRCCSIGRIRFSQWLFLLVVALLLGGSGEPFVSALVVRDDNTVARSYQQARQVRIEQGHEAAVDLYARLLLEKDDMTVATRLAARRDTPALLKGVVTKKDPATGGIGAEKMKALRRLLEENDYMTQSIARLMGAERTAQSYPKCPLFVTPAAAGTVSTLPRFQTKTSVLAALVSLFLVGLAVPYYHPEHHGEPQDDSNKSPLSPDTVNLLMDLGLVTPCIHQDDLLLGLVSIVPLDLEEDNHENDNHQTLYFMTDWHPRVLASIHVTQDDHAVMYIGPDSLALVQHWLLDNDQDEDADDESAESDSDACLLDLCTGSGIHAIVALAARRAARAICVDVNPRALGFVRMNAMLNQIPNDALVLVQGNLVTGKGRLYDDRNNKDDMEEDLVVLLQRLAKGKMQYVTANPPFLPVPPEQMLSERRHGLFSAGGPNGEQVLRAILALANTLLDDHGTLAAVSEFFFAETPTKDTSPTPNLVTRLQDYWEEGGSNTTGSKGLLLTNEFPLCADEYAQRRADSWEEYQVWNQHLEQLHVTTASPGLLYIKKTGPQQDSQSPPPSSHWIHHRIVPRSSAGSIWTPGNGEAIAWTRAVAKDVFGNSSK